MTLYENISIEDFAEVTSSKRIFLNDYVEEGIPFWRSKEVIEQFKGSNISNELFITEEKYYDIKDRFGVPKCGNILITSVGTIGVPFLVKDDSPFYFKDGNLTWIKNISDSVDPKYLFLWISSQIGQQTIDNQIIGSSQKALTITALKKIKVPIPPLPTQKKIAKILSNYDDLIENNLKRIKLVEERAKLTYEEWFLRFRIDGKKLEIDSDSGLPFGWELVKVGSLLQHVNATVKIKSSEILESGKNPVVDQSTDFIAGYTNESNINQFKDNSFIVFGDHTRILKFVNFSFARGADGTQILISNNSRMPQTLFYHSLVAVDLSNYHYARHFKFLKEEKVIVPEEDIASKYNIVCISIFDQIKNLRNQNQLLKETRDILLPRLMTGMINTDELDVAV
jgi:type I restriction enzyme, S subunit